MTYHSKRKFRAAAKGSRGVTKVSRTPRITLHLPKEDIAALRKFATMRREPVSSLVRDAVASWLVHEKSKNPFIVPQAAE
jgi:hypothetical protein